MSTKSETQLLIEAKYRFIIKLALLFTLVMLVLIDALFDSFAVPIELELAIVAAVAGLETREQIQRAKYRSMRKLNEKVEIRAQIKAEKKPKHYTNQLEDKIKKL